MVLRDWLPHPILPTKKLIISSVHHTKTGVFDDGSETQVTEMGEEILRTDGKIGFNEKQRREMSLVSIIQ
jgi:hypothetical protein